MQPQETSFKFLRSPLLFWVAFVLLLGWFLSEVSGILLPFVLGMLLAYCFDPIADRLERAGFSRTAATALLTVLLFTTIIAMLVWLMPILARQLAGLVSIIPEVIGKVENVADDLMHRFAGGVPVLEEAANGDGLRAAIKTLSDDVMGSPGELVQKIMASGGAILNTLSLLFITPIVSFYALRDWDKMKEKVDGLLPCDYAPTIREQAQEIDRTLAGFLRGQVNVMLILAVYYCIVLTVVGVPFSIVIGILSAVLIIVPYVGTFVSMALGLGAVWIGEGFGTTLYITLGIYMVGQVLESQILTPKIVGDKVGLHPLWMLFAMLSGAALFGFVGVLLAVPVAAVLGVLVRFALGHYKASAYYLGRASTAEPTVLL